MALCPTWNLIQSFYCGLPVPIWFISHPYLSDFISYSSPLISIWASLMFFTHTKFSHPSIYVLSAPFRTSPFPNTHVNSLYSFRSVFLCSSVITHTQLLMQLVKQQKVFFSPLKHSSPSGRRYVYLITCPLPISLLNVWSKGAGTLFGLLFDTIV